MKAMGYSLKEAAGQRYRIRLEEGFKLERPEVREPERRWYEQIPVRGGGFIGLFQEHPTVILQYSTPRQRKICREIAEDHQGLAGLRLDDQMDGWETVLYFPPALLETVCERVGARRKRQGKPLTDDHQRKLQEGSRRHRLGTPKTSPNEVSQIGGGAIPSI